MSESEKKIEVDEYAIVNTWKEIIDGYKSIRSKLNDEIVVKDDGSEKEQDNGSKQESPVQELDY